MRKKSNFPKDEILALTANEKYYITFNQKTQTYTAYDINYKKLGTANNPTKLEKKFNMYGD